MISKIYVFLALMLVLAMPLCTARGYGYSYGYQEEGGHNNAGTPLVVAVDTSCTNNVVTITGNNAPLPNAHVTVVDVAGGSIFSGNTDTDGKVSFTGCGMTVSVYATASGYLPGTKQVDLVACAQCTPGGQQPTGGSQCSADDGCAANQRCSNQTCIPVTCDCGTVTNHQCVKYACCADKDCKANETCTANHVCTPAGAAPTGGCTSDESCPATQRCSAASGQCEDVTGCGRVENHQLVPYECGTGANCPSCPQGQRCADNQCIASDLTRSDGGLTATDNGQPCAFCTLVITDPDGTTHTEQTDANGRLNLTLGMPGAYSVALMKDGEVIKTLTFEVPPTPEGGAPPDNTLLLLLVAGGVVVIVVIGGVVYFKWLK